LFALVAAESRLTTPPTSLQDARIDNNASMRSTIGNRELKGLTGSWEVSENLEGTKNTIMPVSTFSPGENSSQPPSHIPRTPVALWTLRVPIEQDNHGSETAPEPRTASKDTAPSLQHGIQRLGRENENEMGEATKKAITRDSKDVPLVSSPSKMEPSKRQRLSERPVSNTLVQLHSAKLQKEKSTESDGRLLTPTTQRQEKEFRPRSRSSSILPRNTSRSRTAQIPTDDQEITAENSEEDESSGKPFRCNDCRKGYSRKGGLLRHRRNAHGEHWSTPRRNRESQIPIDDDIDMSESFTPIRRSRMEQLATPTKAPPQSRNSSPLSSTSRRIQSQTKQQKQSDEMLVSSPTINLSLKRKRDGPVDTRKADPSPANIASSSPVLPASKTTPNGKRQREHQPAQQEEVSRPRSSSLSSEKTIEDITQTPRGETSRTLWPAGQDPKGPHPISGHLSEKDNRGPSTSPEPSAPLSLSGLEKTSNVSISTASTSFSSLLRSSQPSKRIVSHGKEVVLGSDDDDSDGSLPDLDQLLGKNKRKTNSVPKAKVADPEPKKKYSFSLDTLLQAEKQAVAAEARIEAAKSKFQMPSNYETLQNAPVVTRDSAMACLVENGDQDEGKARRVREAFRRTQACDFHEVWHFFNEELPERPKHPFPTVKTSNKLLASIFNDPARRHQALVTGFLPKLALHTVLPKELLLWMMEEVCRERKEVLVQSYIKILDASLDKHEQIINSTQIESLFKQMGASAAALSPGNPIAGSSEPIGTQKRTISSRVHILVTLLESLAKHMSLESRGYALHLLILANFDDSVVQDGYLGVRIEAAIDTLLKTVPGENFEQEILLVGEILFDTVKSPVLRLQLISALPCYSVETHHFRRQLALAFALNSARHLESALDNSKLINHILLSLQKSKHFRINKKTDYTITDAYFSMLDVAIDIGFSDCNFASASPADSGIGAAEDQPEASRKSLFAPRNLHKALINAKEKAFNEDIDLLSKEIRDIMSLILDSGASDMSRTECKATAGRVVKRLENGVRTKVKPTKDWYNRNEKGKSLMEGFVRKEPVEQLAIAEGSERIVELADDGEGLPAAQGRKV
jgi:hypothetical protein